MHDRFFRSSLLILVSFILIGCGDAFDPTARESSGASLDEPLPAEPKDPQNPVEPVNPNPPLDICSELNFNNVQWSTRFSNIDRNAFAIALNLSGSFEGNSGWSNLTNNFDGQGISMGLLNQTLGTGSLQPLLYEFKKDFPKSYAEVLNSAQRSTMDTMINQWAKAKGLSKASLGKLLLPSQLFKAFSNEGLDLEKTLVKKAVIDKNSDLNKKYQYINTLQALGAAESQSVQWALANVYTSSSGRTFKSEWKTALKKLASHPDYISLQIVAAESLHDRALRYSDIAGFSELRAYLMLFDIAVQNGSIRQSHFNSFFSWLKNNPKATEEQALLQLIEIRVASSKPEFQDDVRSRKKSIVLGTGRVHGANRNYPKEYCYNSKAKYPSGSLLNP